MLLGGGSVKGSPRVSAAWRRVFHSDQSFWVLAWPSSMPASWASAMRFSRRSLNHFSMDFASTIPSLPISVAVKAVAADAIAAGPSPSTMPAPMSIIPCFSLSTARMTNVEDMGYRMANRAKYQLRTPATRLQMDSLGCFWGFLTGCLLI